MNNSTPEMAPDRVERRRRSGVRAAWVWGTVLLAGVMLYAGIFALSRHFKHLSWSKAVNAALLQGKVNETAALLAACAKNAPELARTPRFAIWQNRLLELQQQQEKRRAEFERKLSEIKKIIDSPDSEKAVLETLLINAAGFAQTPEELSQVRELQNLCETLARVRSMEALQGAVGELRSLKNNIERLSEWRRKRDFAQHRMLAKKSAALLQDISQKYNSNKELSGQIFALRKRLDSEIAAGARAEESYEKEKNAFNHISSGKTADNILRRCQEFLKKYPDSERAFEARNLASELSLLQKDRAGELQKKLDDMHHRAVKTLQNLRTALPEFISKEIQEKRHELALYLIADPAQGRLHDVLLRLETWEAPRWSAPDDSKMRSVSFKDIAGRKIVVQLNDQGHGAIKVGNERSACRLAWGEVKNELPQAYWQTFLLELDLIVQQVEVEKLPRMLEKFKRLTLQEEYKFPRGFSGRLQKIWSDAEKVLHQSAGEFMYQKMLLTKWQKNSPVFAGLIRLNKNGKVEFYAANISGQNGTLWRLDAEDKVQTFKVLGMMKNGRPALVNTQYLRDNKFHAAAVPADGTDCLPSLTKDRAAAHKYSFKLPELPDFLR